MSDEPPAIPQHYRIVSLQRSKPPKGFEGSKWHRYVIGQGANTIQGYRQGEIGAVRSAVELLVAQMNERRAGKRGHAHLVSKRK